MRSASEYKYIDSFTFFPPRHDTVTHGATTHDTATEGFYFIPAQLAWICYCVRVLCLCKYLCKYLALLKLVRKCKAATPSCDHVA